VWNDPPAKGLLSNISKDEIILYEKAQRINPLIVQVNRKGEVAINFKPKLKLMTIATDLKNDSLAFYIEPFN
jgi:hypothetical protein